MNNLGQRRIRLGAHGSRGPGRVLWLVLATVLVVCGAVGLATPSPVSITAAPAAVTPIPARASTGVARTPVAPATAPTRSATPAAAPATPAPPVVKVVRLRPGDTLWALARRYATTVATLQSLNGLGRSTRVYAGADLAVHSGPAATVSSATPPSAKTAAPITHRATIAADRVESTRQAAAALFGSQYGCAANIIVRESGWKVHATNPTSGAYGLAQALPGSKMAITGPDWRTDPITQLRWMLSYVDARYRGACGAWAFWQAHAWY